MYLTNKWFYTYYCTSKSGYKQRFAVSQSQSNHRLFLGLRIPEGNHTTTRANPGRAISRGFTFSKKSHPILLFPYSTWAKLLSWFSRTRWLKLKTTPKKDIPVMPLIPTLKRGAINISPRWGGANVLNKNLLSSIYSSIPLI